MSVSPIGMVPLHFFYVLLCSNKHMGFVITQRHPGDPGVGISPGIDGTANTGGGGGGGGGVNFGTGGAGGSGICIVSYTYP